jgi:hypothetical protein
MEAKKENQRAYRIVAAFVSGTGFAGLVFLLLKALILTILSLPLSIFLFPGGILTDLLVPYKESGLPLGVLAANALVYSVVAYVAISTFWRSASAVTMRRATKQFAVPAAILFGLACVPALNPLWPRGLNELTKQESELQVALPLGIELNQARAILQSKGIEFREETESSANVILQREERLTVAAGDRLLSARFQTNASVFPCGYDMEIVLLFGRNDKLKQQYIHRFRICP